jgi:pimeloyl-ACP methyl ester carboxylesterase
MASEPVELHVESVGTGPAICFLHGFGGSARNFRPQVRALRDRYHVVTFDARGHARSEAPPSAEAYRLEAFVDDIERVLDSAGMQRATLVGVSMGAALAVSFGQRVPERVQGLLLAAVPSSSAPELWALPFADAIEQDGLEGAGARFVWGGGRFDAEAAKLIRQGFMEHAPHALVATLRNVLGKRRDLAREAKTIRDLGIPQRLVVGERDGPSLAACREIVKEVSAVPLDVIPGAGHIVNLHAPAAFNEVVTSFVNEVS